MTKLTLIGLLLVLSHPGLAATPGTALTATLTAPLTVTLAAASATPITTTLADLQAADQLRLRIWLEPLGSVVVGEEVQVAIEVATRRWFAGGTRIRLPEVDGLIILRRDQFATNQSRREGEVTWVVQQWHLELYPQRAGNFTLPALSLELAVNDATAGVVRGSVETEALSFAARIPAALSELEYWVATPHLSVSDHLDRELTALKPGDAFTREVQLQATHVTAMMLPEVLAPASPGLSAYADLPELEDRSNRGAATAIRRQRITYVVEKVGHYQLPEQVFYWWDTGEQLLREAVLPALTIEAGGMAGVPAATAGTNDTVSLQPAPAWMAIAAGVILAAALWHYRRRNTGIGTERAQWRHINRALRRRESALAVRLLYQWLNSLQPAPDWLRVRTALATRLNADDIQQLDYLLAQVYAESPPEHSSELQLSRAQRKVLHRHLRSILQAPPLTLNPADSQPR